jgi:hypothetical protein
VLLLLLCSYFFATLRQSAAQAGLTLYVASYFALLPDVTNSMFIIIMLSERTVRWGCWLGADGQRRTFVQEPNFTSFFRMRTASLDQAGYRACAQQVPTGFAVYVFSELANDFVAGVADIE